MRRNIDAWWPHVAAGIEGIVVTASGCGVQVRDYGHALAADPLYRAKAERISALCRDPAEVLAAERTRLLPVLEALRSARGRIAVHSPCTLQHGLKLRGVMEEFLGAAGYALTPVSDGHLCCGSAGTYSILQPEIAGQLRDRKLSNLQARGPELIATANIGCQTHLAAADGVPVVHWIGLLDERA